MINKKGAEMTMNTLVVLIVVALVIGGVFYFIIRAEISQRLTELPFEEYKESEIVVLPEECPVKLIGGIWKYSTSTSYFRDYLSTLYEVYITGIGGLDYIFAQNRSTPKATFQTPLLYIRGKNIYLDKPGFDKRVGYVKEIPPRNYLYVPCYFAMEFRGLAGSFFLKGYVDKGGYILCRDTEDNFKANEIPRNCTGKPWRDLSKIFDSSVVLGLKRKGKWVVSSPEVKNSYPQKYLCKFEEDKEEQCIIKDYQFCSVENSSKCITYQLGDALIYKPLSDDAKKLGKATGEYYRYTMTVEKEPVSI